VFELRSSMKGDEFVLVAAADGLVNVERALVETEEHERQVNESVRKAVDESRGREKEEASDGISSNEPEVRLNQEGSTQDDAKEGVTSSPDTELLDPAAVRNSGSESNER
jgi:hypothetical protein